MNVIPSWVYWVIIAALGALVFTQQTRIEKVKRETAELRSAYDKQGRERAEELANYKDEKAKIAAEHAAAQQGITDDFQKQLRAAQDRLNERSALVGRLRAQIASYTSISRTPGETDAVVIQRATDRLQAVGSLLAEGTELVAEGASIVERRDAEVALLVNQVRVDRQACLGPR